MLYMLSTMYKHSTDVSINTYCISTYTLSCVGGEGGGEVSGRSILNVSCYNDF